MVVGADGVKRGKCAKSFRPFPAAIIYCVSNPPSLNGSSGFVTLVGAGPGDCGLITVAGMEALRQAQVVVFDALANPELLKEAPADAEFVDCGKRADAHTLTQDEINAIIVEKAQSGRRVVRLKGGDPYLFGRGAEEAAHCAGQGVACRVIPGITSGLAAPAAAGIPVTHRKIASTVTLVTGHEDPTKEGTAVDYEGLARLIAAGGTVSFYMGASRAGAIADALMAKGLPPQTPAAVVQWGTRPNQKSARATLATLEARMKEAGLGSPAIIVVGQVCAVEEPGLDWHTSRPLFGKRVLVTRTRQQASELAVRLGALGAQVIEAPTIELVAPESFAALDGALAKKHDWLLLTSLNAVNAVADRLSHLGLDARALAGMRVACVGEATARATRATLGLRADLVPARATAEALADALAPQAAGQSFLLPQADIGRPLLEERLQAAGGRVERVTVYETRIVSALSPEALLALRQGMVDWVSFTSSSTARNLVTLLGEEASLLGRCKLASIGPETTRTLVEAGLHPDCEAVNPGVDGLLAAITAAA